MALRSNLNHSQKKILELFNIVKHASQILNQKEIANSYSYYEIVLNTIYKTINHLALQQLKNNSSVLHHLIANDLSYFANLEDTKKITDFIIENIISQFDSHQPKILFGPLSQKVEELMRHFHLKNPISFELILKLIKENYQEYSEKYIRDSSEAYKIIAQKFKQSLSKDTLQTINEECEKHDRYKDDLLNLLIQEVSIHKFWGYIAKHTQEVILTLATKDQDLNIPKIAKENESILFPLIDKLNKVISDWKEHNPEAAVAINLNAVKKQYFTHMTQQFYNSLSSNFSATADDTPTIKSEIARRIDEENKNDSAPKVYPKSKVDLLVAAMGKNKLSSFKIMLKNINLKELSALEKHLGEAPLEYFKLIQQQKNELERKASKIPESIFYHADPQETPESHLKLVI